MMVRAKPIEESISGVVQSEQGLKASVSGEALMRTQLYWLRETECKTVPPLQQLGSRVMRCDPRSDAPADLADPRRSTPVLASVAQKHALDLARTLL